MARYFLTGATGFLGGRLARRLLADGHRVVTVVRRAEAAGEMRALGLEAHTGDILDRASLAEPMRGADGVFHLAAWYKIGTHERELGWKTNVEGTRNVLETMRELGVAKGVYTSTLAVFGDTHGQLVDESYRAGGPWLSEYDRTKWAAHYEVAEPLVKAGLPLVILQSGVIYGPGDTSSVRQTLIQYITQKLPMLPGGAEFCWAHVDDVARAHVLAMERGRSGETYIVAGPRHSLVDAMRLAERISGVPAPRFVAPPAMLKAVAAVMSVIQRMIEVPDAYSAEALRVIAGITYLGDSAKAKRELGYDPRPLEPGLCETLEHEMALLGMKPRGR